MQETMWLTGNTKPLSPEITTRVTGNESLHQRDAVFVKKREVIRQLFHEGSEVGLD
jgi:hypothetical protein